MMHCMRQYQYSIVRGRSMGAYGEHTQITRGGGVVRACVGGRAWGKKGESCRIFVVVSQARGHVSHHVSHHAVFASLPSVLQVH